MFKKLILLVLFITSISFNASAETNMKAGQFISMGVTDDANLTPKMLRVDSNGYLKTTLGTAIVEGTDTISAYPPRYSYTNITTNTDTQVKSAAGFIGTITVNTAGTGSTAVLYDNTSCAAPAIGTFTTTTQASIAVNGYYPAGLCITTAGSAAANLTVWWK